ncbi:MAG: methyl-accepting chemotaxis protein [Synergistaceae bacterium]|nr:methyl-accepting chemotaxis protein [Synergistaceae bacterium]
MRLRNLRTITKILFIVCLMTVLLLFVTYTGYSTSGEISRRMQSMYLNNAKIALGMTEAKFLALQNRFFILSMTAVIDNREVQAYESQVMENRKVIAGIVAELDEAKLTPEQLSVHRYLKSIGPDYRKKQDEAISIIKSKIGYGELSARLTKGDIAQSENEYVDSFDNLRRLLVAKADEMEKQVVAFAQERAIRIASMAAIAVAVGLLTSALVSRAITKPIHKILNSVHTFADGNLADLFPTEGRDELAGMGQALNVMTERLWDIINSVKNANENILTTSQEFSSLAQETEIALDGFRTNVDEVSLDLTVLAADGDLVRASSSESAEGAQATAQRGMDIANKVSEAIKAGNDGMSSVQNALSGIDGVAGNASSAAKSVQELSERTHKIQAFVTQIGGIADQTNLLALNAAIEAARAGEAGRGFAVVAEEVRKLAEESNIAAKNIEELAKTILGDLDSVVTMSLDNADASKAAKQMFQETEKLIENILSYLDEISDSTRDFASLTEQQVASSEKIADTVHDIAERVQRAAEAGENIRTGVEEVATATGRISTGALELSKLADVQEELLSFFKLDAPEKGPSSH